MANTNSTDYLDVARAGSQLISTAGQGIARHERARDIVSSLRPIQAQQTNAAMLQQVLGQQHFASNLSQRKNLLTDIAKLRAPESIQERAAKLPGYTTGAKGIAATAKAAGGDSSILDAARLIRKGARHHREQAVQRAWQDAEQDVQERIEKAETAAQKAEARRQKLMRFFQFYNQYTEQKKAEEAARAKGEGSWGGAATGAASGALSGAAVGSAGGPIGTAIGGVVGGIVGGVGGFFS